MMKRNRSNETTQLLAGIFAVSALVCVALLVVIAAVLVLPFAMLALSGYLLCWSVWSAVTAGRVEQSARSASELSHAVLDDLAWGVATAEHATSRVAVWAADPVCDGFGWAWFAVLDSLVGPEPAPALAGGDVGDYPPVSDGVESPAGIEEGQHAVPSIEQSEQTGARSGEANGAVTVRDLTNETTGLEAATVEQPQPTVLPEGKNAADVGCSVADDQAGEQHHGWQPAPVTHTGDAALDEALALIALGKSAREAARLLGIPESTLRGKLKRWKKRRPQTAAA